MFILLFKMFKYILIGNVSFAFDVSAGQLLADIKDHGVKRWSRQMDKMYLKVRATDMIVEKPLSIDFCLYQCRTKIRTLYW